MKTLLLTALMVISSLSLAQREFGVHDSTFYILNADTTIVAGQKKLYASTSGGLSLIRDFTTGDDRYFIRDFDIVTDSVWYTLVGSRFGGDTDLFKTVDKGANWFVDTSFFSVSRGLVADNFNSINQVQRLSADTLVLFVGYYESGLVYSIDGGDSWRPWFRNLIAFYHGFFMCETDYYLFGIEGDGFPSSMFRVPRTLLFSPDTNNVWTHWTGGTVYHPACYDRDTACIFAPNSISLYNQYLFHKNYIDSICSTATSVEKNEVRPGIHLYPNPQKEGEDIILEQDINPKVLPYQIFNIRGMIVQKGRTFSQANTSIKTSSLGPGLYMIIVRDGEVFYVKKIMIQ
ncbi:MAG: T9SS type A sorting domain-containing protein [Bacteroidia bacterium]